MPAECAEPDFIEQGSRPFQPLRLAHAAQAQA
jgi:hypothetical protein